MKAEGLRKQKPGSSLCDAHHFLAEVLTDTVCVFAQDLTEVQQIHNQLSKVFQTGTRRVVYPERLHLIWPPLFVSIAFTGLATIDIV